MLGQLRGCPRDGQGRCLTLSQPSPAPACPCPSLALPQPTPVQDLLRICLEFLISLKDRPHCTELETEALGMNHET